MILAAGECALDESAPGCPPMLLMANDSKAGGMGHIPRRWQAYIPTQLHFSIGNEAMQHVPYRAITFQVLRPGVCGLDMREKVRETRIP